MTTPSYNTGDLVYYPDTIAARVYMSLINNNTATPSLTAPAYDATTLYNPGDMVTSSSVIYESIWPAGDNLGNTPVSSPAQWRPTPTFSMATTYNLNDIVFFNDVLYKSLIASNLGHQVDSSPSQWQVFQPDLAIGGWLLLDATLAQIINPAPLYPDQAVFPLPNGYLRTAVQDPHAGQLSILGAPGNASYKDWNYEGDFLISADASPIVGFRFAADVSDTSKFDPMFAEAFACSIAKEVCQPITQSTEKVAEVQADYKKIMGEARIVNGIEVGSQPPPLDDLLNTRF